jgi:hypothetical protein
MTTAEFLAALRAHPEQPLVFQYGDALVPAGYHVTEVKAVQYQTMDCGGQGNAWTETIVQLWNPDVGDAPEWMSAGKFLSIFERAAAGIPVDEHAELRLEYGNDTLPATNFSVGRLERQSDGLTVHLEPPRVTCKARDRRGSAPAFTMLETSGASCAPDGTCCG